MILSFIDIEDYRSPGFPENGKGLRNSPQTAEETNNSASSKTIEHESSYDTSPEESSAESKRYEKSNEGLRKIDYSSRFFGDTFELRYLQHKDKIEKERFARELLAGRQ